MVGGLGYFLFFLVAFLTLTILVIWPVFPYVVLAILLAYLLHPLNCRLEKSIRSASVRAGLLTLFVLIAVALPLLFAAQKITRELGASLQLGQAQRLLEKARLWLTGHQAEAVANSLQQTMERGRDFLLGSLPVLFGSVFNIILGIFVCLFVFYYLTKEGESIWRAFLNTLPLPGKLKSEVSREVTGILKAIFFGQLLTAVVQGIVGGIGLAIFQVPQVFLLTAVMILLSFFPFVGTPLVHSQVHPVVILIGIIGGSKVFGFVGFLVGPVIFAIFLQLLRFFAEYRANDEPPPASPANESSQAAPVAGNRI